ncbi:hypothetical protein D770_20415 [Flammeovirgaceae bacterium 311]|nr:hypothetical protein D770_20415 [Flammeovirgaceae bacterium 311]
MSSLAIEYRDKRYNTIKLLENFQHKERRFSELAEEAETYAEKSDLYDKKWLYSEAHRRCVSLCWRIRDRYDSDPNIRRWVKREMASTEYKCRLERKEEKRQEFLNKHRYQVHFMQTSLRADYGQFRCDRCNQVFYHSPSTILLAEKEVYSCCCGHCTNSIIYKDWGKEPFS